MGVADDDSALVLGLVGGVQDDVAVKEHEPNSFWRLLLFTLRFFGGLLDAGVFCGLFSIAFGATLKTAQFSCPIRIVGYYGSSFFEGLSYYALSDTHQEFVFLEVVMVLEFGVVLSINALLLAEVGYLLLFLCDDSLVDFSFFDFVDEIGVAALVVGKYFLHRTADIEDY